MIADDDGNPRVLPNAICMHEEDDGVLWKHTDAYNGTSSVRRQRRLVVSFFMHLRFESAFVARLFIGPLSLASAILLALLALFVLDLR